jgi:hypothetical protein
MTNTAVNTKSNTMTSVVTNNSPRSPPSKAIVAKSDFDRVLQTIDRYMEEKRSTLRRQAKAQSADEGDPMEVDEDIHEEKKEDGMDQDGVSEQADPQDEFLSHCQASLKERLYQVVEPISDEEYHRRTRGPFIQEEIRQEEAVEREWIAREEAAVQAKEEALREIEGLKATKLNNDYDDHELIDQDALKRAKELRAKIRELSTQTKRQQEIVLQRVIQLTKREILLLTHDILAEEVDPLSQERSGELSTAKRQTLQRMQASLQALTNSLSNTVDRALPKNLRDLRETIHNIQKTLQKRDQPFSLSQTEQAIVSRDNEGANTMCSLDEDAEGPIRIQLDGFSDLSNPEFVLAEFLSRY